MQLKYMGSKSWLAPHVFEPVANLRRCYLRREPVFLRSLLRLAGRKIDRRFYFSRLLPGTQRGRAGRWAGCLYVLLRNSFSGKWGSFAQQRPLALSSVRRLQRPPTNVTVRCQDALAHLRALPRQAPRQAIYADPPYIFPDRSMNYYGTRRRGMTWPSTQSSETRSSFLVSINDVPEAWEHPVAAAGLRQQSCAQHRIARAAPGPHQARTRPQSDFGMERGRISDFAFPSLLRTFRPKESGDEAVTLQ